jgi:hypothetical protein
LFLFYKITPFDAGVESATQPLRYGGASTVLSACNRDPSRLTQSGFYQSSTSQADDTTWERDTDAQWVSTANLLCHSRCSQGTIEHLEMDKSVNVREVEKGGPPNARACCGVSVLLGVVYKTNHCGSGR